MIRPPLNHLQKAAFRELFEIADRRGLTASWSPANALEIDLEDTTGTVPMVVALADVEATWPGLLTVLNSDPVVRLEAVSPRVTIWLGSWARELLREGFFHGDL